VTGLATTGASPVLLGVGPKNMQISGPSGQYAMSPAFTSVTGAGFSMLKSTGK